MIPLFEAFRLPLRAGGQRARRAGDADALGGGPLPPPHRPVRRRGDRRRGPRPRALGRPGGGHGVRVVRARGFRSRRWCDFPALVTTCTDGDNGGWFRNIAPEANYWGYFHRNYMEHVRAGTAPSARPSSPTTWIATAPTGSSTSRRSLEYRMAPRPGLHPVDRLAGAEDAFARAAAVSRAVHELKAKAQELRPDDQEVPREVEEALWHLLRAETTATFSGWSRGYTAATRTSTPLRPTWIGPVPSSPVKPRR